MGKRKHVGGGSHSGKKKAPKFFDVRTYAFKQTPSYVDSDHGCLHVCSFLKPRGFQRVVRGCLLAACREGKSRVSGKPLIFWESL